MNKSIAYIGTYTNGASEGIYRLCLDTDKGNIEDLNLDLVILLICAYITINYIQLGTHFL